MLGFLYNRRFIFGSTMHDRSILFFRIHLLAGVMFLVIWFLIGIISIKFIRSRMESFLLLNASAFLMLLLQLYQTLAYGRPDFIGNVTYYFFFPFFRLSLTLTFMFYEWAIYDFLQYVVPFFGLLIFSFWGRVIAEQRSSRTK